ncbi:methyl-accepting chemotaxis sensory transducer with Cache sensor [Gracilibacillus ureilyticus]|uniref:Methyl-accepting chemotaxis sensory transducer with Cache sensor n=1 Tax=Gracilibacillus ureilyticus TaxID=531814 RepID=A0A1H9MNM8_9BACI|nr:methyl-accepting chemotaxis protein [Gracilibacillus ureilyticus]SER25238.1 methyl-accepting chemotaxis sensory transducer with Cache sensor [Gracilibacillus ureilyticus]
MAKFRRIQTVRSKLVTISLLLLVVPLVITGYLVFNQSENALNELGETNLKNSVIMTLEMIDSLNEEVERGNVSLEVAQAEVKEAILGELQTDGTRPINKEIDLGENGYVYITDTDGILLAHPRLEGDSLWESQDSEGDYFAQEFTEKALNGGGFTYYDWPLPDDENKVEEKVVYSAYDENWDWVVTSGSYLMDYNAPVNTILYQIIFVTVFFIVIGIIITWVFSNRITNPLTLVTNRMRELASGDLTNPPIEVKTKDELKILATEMNHMQENLYNMISNISEASASLNQQSDALTKSSEEVRTGAEQVTTTMQELASGAEVQADHVSTLSQMMENFKDIVSETNQAGISVGDTSIKVLENAESGRNLMQSSANQMTKIDEIVKDAVEKVRSLDTQSQEIGRLVAVIHDIAEQTNLLALNAAIEAARAGEQGKGFSVVADEVRKLAEQVSASVSDITGIVSRIQAESTAVSNSLEAGYGEVEKGTSQILTTQHTFTEIDRTVNEMVGRMKSISNNLTTVSAKTEEMNESIQEIASTSEQSAAGIEETSASAEQSSTSMEEVSNQAKQLAELSTGLKNIVGDFQLNK